MNDRIKELAALAGVEHTQNLGVEQFYFEKEELEKFAELLIKECCAEISVSEPPGDDYASGEYCAGYDQGLTMAIASIKNRFSNGTV